MGKNICNCHMAEVVSAIDLDRMMLESDAQYQLGHPCEAPLAKSE